MKEKKVEVSMEKCKTLILFSKNDGLNSYCNSLCASNHAKSFVLIPKEELYIKDQWAQQFGKEVVAYKEQDIHWAKIFYHYISRPNVLIDMQHVLILDLHDTFDVHDAYALHNLSLGHGIKSLRF